MMRRTKRTRRGGATNVDNGVTYEPPAQTRRSKGRRWKMRRRRSHGWVQCRGEGYRIGHGRARERGKGKGRVARVRGPQPPTTISRGGSHIQEGTAERVRDGDRGMKAIPPLEELTMTAWQWHAPEWAVGEVPNPMGPRMGVRPRWW